MSSNVTDVAFINVPVGFAFTYFDIVQIVMIMMEIYYEPGIRSGDVEKRQSD